MYYVDDAASKKRVEDLQNSLNKCFNAIEQVCDDIDSIYKVLNQLRSYDGARASSNQEITQDNETVGKVVVGYRYSTWNISISGDENIAHSLKGLDAARDNLNELMDLALESEHILTEISFDKRKILSILSSRLGESSSIYTNKNYLKGKDQLIYHDRETHTGRNRLIVSKSQFYNQTTKIGTIQDSDVKRVIEVKNFTTGGDTFSAAQAITYYPDKDGYFVTFSNNDNKSQHSSMLEFVTRDGEVVKRRILKREVGGHAGSLQYNEKTKSIELMNGSLKYQNGPLKGKTYATRTRTSIKVDDFFDNDISDSNLKYSQVKNLNDYKNALAYDKTTGNTITTNNFNGNTSDTFILKEPNGTVRTFPKMNASGQDICANDGVIIAVEKNDIAFYDEKTGNYLGSQTWPDYVTYKKTNQVPEGYLNNTFANYKNEHSLENYYKNKDPDKNGRAFELESVTHLGGNRYAVLTNLPKTLSQTDKTSTFGDLIYEVEYSFTD